MGKCLFKAGQEIKEKSTGRVYKIVKAYYVKTHGCGRYSLLRDDGRAERLYDYHMEGEFEVIEKEYKYEVGQKFKKKSNGKIHTIVKHYLTPHERLHRLYYLIDDPGHTHDEYIVSEETLEAKYEAVE